MNRVMFLLSRSPVPRGIVLISCYNDNFAHVHVIERQINLVHSSFLPWFAK